MVSLTAVKASNSLVASTLPGLVAVFVGATSGIGEASLKAFARYGGQSRVYFVGRSQEAGGRIKEECKALNSKGEYNFIKADVSLLKTVDDVCREIKSKEKAINLLFLCQGSLLFYTETTENLHYALAVSYYSRARFIANLLPLLQNATSLRRVVTVFAGTKEGKIYPDDFQSWKVPLRHARGHGASMATFSLEALAKKAPSVSFIHDYPGHVKTNLIRGNEGAMMVVMSFIFKLMPSAICVSNEECGERHVFCATSARYPASTDGASGVSTDEVARGTDGKLGSGVYSIDENGESAGLKIEEVLANMRKEGMDEKLWSHTEGEFKRITGLEAI